MKRYIIPKFQYKYLKFGMEMHSIQKKISTFALE